MTKRKTLINTQIYCDRDLTVLSSSRVHFEEVETNLYQVKSDLKFYSCEISGFIERLIYRNLGKPWRVKGLCSKPSGYIYTSPDFGVFTQIGSNGSKWAGQAPDLIEILLEVLKKHPLDRTFEAYGGFVTRNPVSSATEQPLYSSSGDVYLFFGNFLTVSHVFRIATNDPSVYEPLRAAIEQNQRREDYLNQSRPEFWACDLETKYEIRV